MGNNIVVILFIQYSLVFALKGSAALQEKADPASPVTMVSHWRRKMAHLPPLPLLTPPMTAYTPPTMPYYPPMIPPAGNTTSVAGRTWCEAKPIVSPADLQNALDWACGLGKADCGPIQPGGVCFEPNTLVSHASYAFNSYYQQHGNLEASCNFGGTAMITRTDPSYGQCTYPSSRPAGPSCATSSSSPRLVYSSFDCWNLLGVLVLLYTHKAYA